MSEHPQYTNTASRHTHTEARPPVPVSRARKRVLLVGREQHARSPLATALRRRGHLVAVLRSTSALLSHLGSALLEHGRPPSIDLVIIDEGTSSRRGWKLVRGLRDAGWDIPVVMLASSDDDGGPGLGHIPRVPECGVAPIPNVHEEPKGAHR